MAIVSGQSYLKATPKRPNSRDIAYTETELHSGIERRLRIIEWYYGIGCERLSDRKIGEWFGITKSRVNPLRQEALWRECDVGTGWR